MLTGSTTSVVTARSVLLWRPSMVRTAFDWAKIDWEGRSS
jgi:hypothetical protein